MTAALWVSLLAVLVQGQLSTPAASPAPAFAEDTLAQFPPSYRGGFAASEH